MTGENTQVARRFLAEVASPSANLDRVVGGRIVEHGGAANMLEALIEIGAVRPVTGP